MNDHYKFHRATINYPYFKRGQQSTRAVLYRVSNVYFRHRHVTVRSIILLHACTQQQQGQCSTQTSVLSEVKTEVERECRCTSFISDRRRVYATVRQIV